MTKSSAGARSIVHVRLFGPDGELKYEEWGTNLVTDYGDEHIAKRIYDDNQDIITGMRLGTGTTDPAKNGTGAAMESYISGSQEALDSTPTPSDKGAGQGYRIQHECTWIAGDVTNGAISKVCLTDETPLTDTAGVAGDTVAIYEFTSAIDKQSGDELVVTWNIDVLGE